MKTMTKILGLGFGALGLLTATSVTIHAIKRRRAQRAIDDELADLADSMVVTEDVIVVTEPEAYIVDVEMIPEEEEQQPSPGDSGR